MMSPKYLDFLTHSHIGSVLYTQPPFQRPLFGDPPPPPMRTSYLEAPKCWYRQTKFASARYNQTMRPTPNLDHPREGGGGASSVL